MIRITQSAAKQIRHSAKQGQMEGMPLRVAAKKNEDGSLHYGIGFDDLSRNGDLEIVSEGITIVVSAQSVPLVRDMEIDYVELEPDKYEFIFKNPNDPHYAPTIQK